MRRHARSAITCSLASALAACGRADRNAPGPGSHPAPGDAPERTYTETDAARAKYHSIDAIIEDAAQARGQLAVVPVARDEIRAGDFTAFPCPGSPAGHRFFLTIPPKGRDRVRAMPASSDGDCPRVLMKVQQVQPTGVSGYRDADGSWKSREDAERVIDAETLAIFDVTPKPPAPTPPGVDYVTYDDLALGPPAPGQIAELVLRPALDQVAERGTTMLTCDGRQPVGFPDQESASALAKLGECHTVRFRLRAWGRPAYLALVDADLIAIDPHGVTPR